MVLSINSILLANRFLFRVGLLISLVFMTLVYFLFPFWIISEGALVENLFMLGIFAFYLGFFILAWRHLSNRAGIFFTFTTLVLSGYLAWQFFLTEEVQFVFPLIGMVGGSIVSYFIILLLPMLINWGILFFTKQRKKWSWRENLSSIYRQVRATRGSFIGAAMLVMVGISSIVILAGDSTFGTILIKPQDYQVKFAFWGSHYMSRYTPIQLDALNRHHVTIAPYTIGNLSTPTARAAFIAEMKNWNTSYPNVSFLPAVEGIPGGFVWDGAARGTTELAKQIVQLVRENNLTNVKGLSFDWEEPIKTSLGEVSPTPNRTRHEESIAIWNEFFDWLETYAPEMVTQNINYVGSSVDYFDGDFDLHYRNKFNTFEVPRWSEYAPMIYRCGYKGTKPFGDIPVWKAGTNVDVTYNFYCQLKSHVEGVVRVHGNVNRAGVYIGITNCTCYGRDVKITEFGQDLGYGYDVLVRDALICKHFGIPQITIFILTTEWENGYSMGGVFDSYGDDFLDKFNASVNGVNSTRDFTIPVGKIGISRRFVPAALDLYVQDLLYSFNNPLLLILLLGIIFLLNYTLLRKAIMKNSKISFKSRKKFEKFL